MEAGEDWPPFWSPFEHDKIRGFDELYEDYEDMECATVPVSTVHVRLDCSKGGQIFVLTAFKALGGILVHTTILFNTGSMAIFINEEFICKHNLKT